MAFNPQVIGVSNTGGAYPSTTTFAKNKDNNLVVTSNGDPYPALSANVVDQKNRTFLDDEHIIVPQNYNFTFVYRATNNTQQPQTINALPYAVFANGVTALRPNKRAIPKCETVLPKGLNYDGVYFQDKFGADNAGGYPDANGAYHYYTGQFVTQAWQNPKFVNSTPYYQATDYNGDNMRHPDGHSKIIGYAFDGYPIYGSWGYQNPLDKLSVVEQMESGYKKLISDNHRPKRFKSTDVIYIDEVETPLELGVFVEDYVYKEAAGDLDIHNGRYCITPDYPEGTYAYFVTFKKGTSEPAYPYILGRSSKQDRSFQIEEELNVDLGLVSLWTTVSGTIVTTLEERKETDLFLPVANNITIDKVELISGTLPPGLRIVGTRLIGTVFEVANESRFRSVLRAHYGDRYEDRTIDINVVGADEPQWVTAEGLLPVGPNNTFFILDSALIDFQLEATDTDLTAGDTLSYYIPDGGGLLPPGISMSESGRITGVTDPLLALDKRFEGGGYDNTPYGDIPIDYGIVDDNGYSSYYYDSETFDFNVPTSNPKKLNRYYPLIIAVTDGITEVRREFTIYVVGDDFLKADNTIMKAGTGVFKADNTNVRNPVWLTPGDLGFRRANNYTTLNLEIINNSTLEGLIRYSMESTNADGSKSTLPPGLSLDKNSGEITGIIPYQPAITIPYKFSVRATRITNDLDLVTIFGTYYEDVLLGKTSFKIAKTNLTGLTDGVDDLFDLIGRDILLGRFSYKVTNVDSRNEEFDIIFLDQSLSPEINLTVSRLAKQGQSFIYVDRLSESSKQKYLGRSLRFADNQVVTIDTIENYIEYEIRQNDPTNDSLYPTTVPRVATAGENYFIGDILYAGPDNKIYEVTTAHSYTTFDAGNFTELAETIQELPEATLVTATKQALDAEFGGDSIVVALEPTRWHVTVRSTAATRVVNNMRDFFMPGADSGVVIANIIKDYEQRIGLNVGLPLQLQNGRNIGIALFRRDNFEENVIVASQEDIDIPSTVKEFDIRIIGEIDSTIAWITPEDLGSIKANTPTIITLEAETTVPDTNMLYRITSGSLPEGMRLSINGDIIGAANQFGTNDKPGLIRWTDVATWDGTEPGDTTFDRQYKFTVEAKDRFGYSAISKTFKLFINDLDERLYTDIHAKPYLNATQKNAFKNFISNSTIFKPSSIYRASDPAFGLQKDLEILVYAGIEAKSTKEFVAAASKNHKRKKYIPGDFKTAVAKMPGTNDVVYEVVYLELKDPAEPKTGKSRKKINIRSQNKISVDSIEFAARDDETRTGLGYDALPVNSRKIVRFIYTEQDTLTVETRYTEVDVNVDNNDFQVELRDTSDVTVKIVKSDSEPTRLRPQTNTIKTDSDAIKAGQSKDVVRYISNITNMRDNIREVGMTERLYLPLWMRTPQDNLQEIDYVLSIPICFCKPGQSAEILKNIQESSFDQKQLNIDIDRYIIKRTSDLDEDQYILFADYQYNV